MTDKIRYRVWADIGNLVDSNNFDRYWIPLSGSFKTSKAAGVWAEKGQFVYRIEEEEED